MFKKPLARKCGIALIIIGLVMMFAVLALDVILKSSVNHVVPFFTKSEASLDDVSISLLKGRVELKGFYIGNPEGYDSKRHVMKIDRVLCDVSVWSLLTNKIIIEDIEVIGFDVNYETKLLKGDNIRALVANIMTGVGGASASKEEEVAEEETGGAKKIQLNHFLIEGGAVAMRFAGSEKAGLSAPLPRIELHDIGKDDDGADVEEVVTVITNKVFAAVGSVATQNMGKLKDNMKNVGESLENVGGDVKEGASEAIKDIKGWFGK
jgi:hypothetical protein